MIESCAYCLSMPLIEETTDKTILEQYDNHPHLVPIETSVGWGDGFSTLFCTECQTFFTEYFYESMEEGEDTQSVHSYYRLQDSPFFEDSLDAVGKFLYHRSEIVDWNINKIKSEYIDVYAMLDVNILSNIQNGKQISTMDHNVDIYESLSHLLHTFWLLRAGACYRYYVKLSVPISTIEPFWNPELGGLGSGTGGFVLNCSHPLSCHEVEVLDMASESFVPLYEWSVPPVYKQDAPEVDEMFATYSKLKDATKEEYEALVTEKNEKIDSLIKDTYEIKPTT